MGNINIEEMAEQFRGRQFGELVLHHIKQQSFEQLVAAMQGTIKGLSNPIQAEITELIDNANSLATKKAFWADDCGKILLFVTSMTNQELQDRGLNPTDDELLDVFNIIVMNFAYSAHKDQRMKRFIKSATGRGFLGRLFG